MRLLTIDRRVGRFVEARVAGSPTEEEVAEWARSADLCLKTCLARTQKIAVACTDVRPSSIYRPAVTELFSSIMRKDNKLLERNAVLGIGGATFTLQLQRLLREAEAARGGEVRRRVFTDPEAAFAWLDEVLTPVERARMREFIAEFDPTTLPTGNPLGGGSSSRPPPPLRSDGAARTVPSLESKVSRAPMSLRPDRDPEPPARSPSSRPPPRPAADRSSPKGGRF